MAVPVAMAVIVVSGRPALTGRISRHSTAGLAAMAAASLAIAQLGVGIRDGHPQLGSERGVAARPVGDEGPRAWPRLVIVLWHDCHTTALPLRQRLLVPGRPE